MAPRSFERRLASVNYGSSRCNSNAQMSRSPARSGCRAPRVALFVRPVEGREILSAATTSAAVEDNGYTCLITIMGRGPRATYPPGQRFGWRMARPVRFSCAGNR